MSASQVDAVVIGGGPAGLMAADVLSSKGHQVVLADAMPSLGRKFLMAGKSGLNLTKDEPMDVFLKAYDPLPLSLEHAVRAFGPKDVVDWAEGLGQTIFRGSSGRIFPDVMKASPLLRAWLSRLAQNNVQFQTRWCWRGWCEDALVFDTPQGEMCLSPKVSVLALGGASWPKLGSTGHWIKHFEESDVRDFAPSNMGVNVAWSPYMQAFFGQPIKDIQLTSGRYSSRGEAILSAKGLEGGGIYEVSRSLRDGGALYVDLRPDWTADKLETLWKKRRSKMSLAKALRSIFRLSPLKAALVQEVLAKGDEMFSPRLLKALPLAYDQPFSIDKAISSSGGMGAHALGKNLELLERKRLFCAGEMLDWDAPTGGYLLSACLALGALAGQSAHHSLLQTSMK